MNARSSAGTVSEWQFDEYILAEVDGVATPEQVAVLESQPSAWRVSLQAMLRDAEQHLKNSRSLPGEERDQVVADLELEVRRLQAAVARLYPQRAERDEPRSRRGGRDDAAEDVAEEPAAPGRTVLQVSWEPGKVVAWAGGPGAPAGTGDEVSAMLAAAGAPATGWVSHAAVVLSGGVHADACAIPVGDVLGWLVAAGAGQIDDEVGASVGWLGQVAIWAVELTARGAMVPQLRRRARRSATAKDSNGSYSVRWVPALVDRNRLERLAQNMPGSMRVIDRKIDARALTRSALTGMVDAICRDAARRVEVPAPPPRVRTAHDVGEAFLARLDGSAFDAPASIAGEVVTRVEHWARLVTEPRARVIVQLDPPDDVGAWHLSVFAPGGNAPVAIERAIVMATSDRSYLEGELARLERMVPALLRPGGMRRGEVILGADEAWELMATTGPQLVAAGFDVRAPQISRRPSRPSLRVYADAVAGSAVGANQLANVRWSAVFDDIELTAADIARLAKQARPLIHTGGRWVALDRVDLEATAKALADHDNDQLSGAELLRLALGLDDSPFAGRIAVEGEGWATDLLAAAAKVSTQPASTPPGFVGELRSYQAEALAWLGFLDSVGLGGCLALDMGLGKTPTLLAHVLNNAGSGPTLVIAPPAVVGNWRAEAEKFTPALRVVVHHGAGRAAPEEIAAEVDGADVVLTTYGTAVRDVDAIAAISWDRVILDEAQAIKNATNDTSQHLRTITARTRIALTGTPIENGLGDLWAILDYTNPGLVGPRPQFIAQLSNDGSATRADAEGALRALNGILVFRRTKAEPEIAAELPDQIDELDHCAMTPEQIGMYQAVLDALVTKTDAPDEAKRRNGQILAAITALKQICNHPAAYHDDGRPLAGRSGKLARLEEIVDAVFAAREKVLVFTHFAEWGLRLAEHFSARTGTPVACYHGGLSRTARDRLIDDFQGADGPGVLVLSLKAGGTGLNLTAANHVVLYDRWWNPAVEDQARDRAWRIGQDRTVICHRLVCPGTVDERVEEVVAGKRRIAELVLPKSSTLADLDSEQLRVALGIRPDALLTDTEETADL